MTAPRMVTVDVAGWTRWNEVQAYADAHGIAVGDAICFLVHTGLSHYHGELNNRPL